MSVFAIKSFLKELEDIKHYGGTTKETAVRFAFQKLLDEYAKTKELKLIAEVSIKLKNGKTVTPDGTLKDVLRLDHGYWESKDEADDINEEINKKFAKGYPNDNILFEDSQTAVLFQHGEEIMRTSLEDEDALDKLLNKFISYQRQEVTDFRKAIEQFKEDIPKVTEALREIINKQEDNTEYKKARTAFHELCKQSINPEITADDIKEMMIQHLITADIFNTIFDEPHFHQENNIARELNKVIETFFTGATRRQTLGSIKHYYDTINAAAAGIADHHEKQKFLKVVYENFYKAYNPKAADRLGIVYTPNEIVQFMIKSTDYLLHKHFGKTMADKNVEILDPATGTGTFICDIIDYLPKNKLEYKYKNELHANELAILPYYIANLNIEYTYKQKTGNYAEFENLCFVDTLDNTGFNWIGKQGDLFGVSAENAHRIKKQNEKKISVVIGNPPYNAKQENYNFQNANKAYKEIDKRIKDTYIKNGTAQNQIVVYDMYTRFFRWASDRIQDDGIICFITNSSYLNGRAFNGFRKSIQEEFQYAYFIDLGGNIRELSGKDGIFLNENHTIFGQAAAVGIAIGFLVKDKKRKLQQCHINYVHPCDIRATRDEKIAFLHSNKMENILFDNILPDKNSNWINITSNDFEELLPLIDKRVKSGKSEEGIFRAFSSGIKSQRDEWVYDYSRENLKSKMKYFAKIYEAARNDKNYSDKNKIKWDRELGKYLERNIEKKFSDNQIISTLYRPYIKQEFYFDRHFNGMTYQWFDIYKKDEQNNYLIIPGLSSPKDFFTLSSNTIIDLNCLPAGGQCLPQYRFSSSDERLDNITDWGLQQFRQHYIFKDKKDENDFEEMDMVKAKKYIRDYEIVHFGSYMEGGVVSEFPMIQKGDIFHYVYAVLHHPAYRKKYELNLKREFPRIPFYDNFPQWVKWGRQLMHLHIGYEKAEPYNLEALETTGEITTPEAYAKIAKAKLKADKLKGTIELDGFTTLTGIPKQAWDYKLGNRSALEWILDQYKEKKPSDPTIAEKFNTYKFADYKEQVIDLLKRVCTVSVETMKIVNAMPE